jgi:NAD(P)-dependent dehydrogenase (short-subunit alcohol dehydrogenase family)
MRTALITGTTSGLGHQVATMLVDDGWEVIGTVRTEADRELLGEVPWEVVVADMTDDAAVEGLGVRVRERWGRLDALVNNAGIAMSGPFEELTPAELRLSIEVNLVGPMMLARACLSALREARGVVVQVASVSGRTADALMGAYNASKFGLVGASEALALEVAPQGVRVVIVTPGPFRTPISRNAVQAAAKGSTGMYAEGWAAVDAWLAWHAAASPDPAECARAIAAAVSEADAPMRLAVGEVAQKLIRRHATAVLDDTERSAAYLAALDPEVSPGRDQAG